MLYIVASVLVLVWLLGLATSYSFGGLIHFLLIIAIIAVLVQLFGGRNITPSENK